MQQSTSDLASGLLTATLVNFLPIENKQVLTVLGYEAGKLIGPAIREVAAIPGRYFSRMFKNTLILDSNDSLYQGVEEYLIRNYLEHFQQCRLAARKGGVNFDLHNAVVTNPIKVPYKEHTIEIQIGQPVGRDGKPSTNFSRNIYDISISCKAPLKVIQEFVVSICENHERSNTQTLKIFRNVGSSKKKRNNNDEDSIPVSWDTFEVHTNRNLANTILAENVEKELLGDIADFMNNRDWYNQKGIPHKLGILLSGPPGTGKTSIVKAIAVHYNLPIFSLDLSIINSNAELTTLMAEINYKAKGQVYILSMEDVDRSNMFSRDSYHRTHDITTDCFLNVLDGIAESHGRLMFLSANDTTPLQNVPALLRPGRIDKVITIDHVTDEQLRRIIQNFYGELEVPGLAELRAPPQLSPAKVINVLRNHRDDPVQGLAAFQSADMEQLAIAEEKMFVPGGRTLSQRRNALQRSKTRVRASKNPAQRLKQLGAEQTQLMKKLATVEKRRTAIQDKIEFEQQKKLKNVQRASESATSQLAIVVTPSGATKKTVPAKKPVKKTTAAPVVTKRALSSSVQTSKRKRVA